MASAIRGVKEVAPEIMEDLQEMVSQVEEILEKNLDRADNIIRNAEDLEDAKPCLP